MTPIDGAELDALVDYWRCANYLTVAQIYLQATPLLREPLRAEVTARSHDRCAEARANRTVAAIAAEAFAQSLAANQSQADGGDGGT